jgi:hypothetical protein
MAGQSSNISKRSVLTNSRPLDNLMMITNRLVCVKMDVEGNEELVLRGAKKLLKRNRVLLLRENLGIKKSNQNFMKSLGFSLVALSQKDQNELWKNW